MESEPKPRVKSDLFYLLGGGDARTISFAKCPSTIEGEPRCPLLRVEGCRSGMNFGDRIFKLNNNELFKGKGGDSEDNYALHNV
jgi:hypothetical protein